jgi:hypothetical protein
MQGASTQVNEILRESFYVMISSFLGAVKYEEDIINRYRYEFVYDNDFVSESYLYMFNLFEEGTKSDDIDIIRIFHDVFYNELRDGSYVDNKAEIDDFLKRASTILSLIGGDDGFPCLYVLIENIYKNELGMNEEEEWW